ncbi:unnamed protein product [Boreogadus saida]
MGAVKTYGGDREAMERMDGRFGRLRQCDDVCCVVLCCRLVLAEAGVVLCVGWWLAEAVVMMCVVLCCVVGWCYLRQCDDVCCVVGWCYLRQCDDVCCVVGWCYLRQCEILCCGLAEARLVLAEGSGEMSVVCVVVWLVLVGSVMTCVVLCCVVGWC